MELQVRNYKVQRHVVSHKSKCIFGGYLLSSLKGKPLTQATKQTLLKREIVLEPIVRVSGQSA